jgi:hypothetical protein
MCSGRFFWCLFAPSRSLPPVTDGMWADMHARGEARRERKGGWMEIDCGVDGNKVVGDAVGGRGMLGLGVCFGVEMCGGWCKGG